MTIEESINAKKGDLNALIASAQALLDDGATAEDINTAMDAVKKAESDLAALQDLAGKTVEVDAPAEESAPSDEADVEDAPAEEVENAPEDAVVDVENVEDNAPQDNQEVEDDEKKTEERNMPVEIETKTVSHRDALNAFLHTKGEKRDGITSVEAGALIPQEIIYAPEAQIDSVTDLSALVTRTNVSTASGKYPILKRASSVLPSVAELEKNPALAKPEFLNVDWEVATHRGYMPISQESIDDAQIDLVGLVSKYINQIQINTTNADIAKVLAGFKAVSVDGTALVDGLKDAVNTDFDVAYNKQFVVTQSMFNELDKAKDADGRYLLQDQIGTATGKSLFGLALTVVEDTAFGGTLGAKQMFVGDLARAILFADRAQVTARWTDNDVYGQLLQVAIRYAVAAADPEAGKFITIAAAPASK